MSENELLHSYRDQGSQEAFAELVRRFAGLVFSVAKRRLANATQAEDVAQVVFIRLSKTPPKVGSDGELAAWLHRTTLNVAIDTWRSEHRRHLREQQAISMEPTSDPLWEEISPKLDQALNRLGDQDRQTLLLRFFGCKSLREVGAAFNVSEDAAKMRVSRAVDRLRTELGVGSAACTTAFLGTMLAERSVEAAPAQIVSRLMALRLPSATGRVATIGQSGGIRWERLRGSGLKLSAGVGLLGFVVTSALYLFHSLSLPNTAPDSSSPGLAPPSPAAPAVRQRLEPGRRLLAGPPKPVKILLHVLESETGRGLAGAKAHAAFFGSGGEGESQDALTDANGDAPIWEPDDPSKNRGPNVFVVAEGHVPKVVGFRGPVPAGYAMRLDSARTAGGTIVDEQGLPVAGVKILIQGPGNKPGQVENVDFQTCPITNRDDGTWTCSYIPKDYTEIRLILKKPSYAVTFPVVPADRVELTNLVLVINRGFVLAGQISDETGRPIADADIRLLSGDSSRRMSAKTDEQGQFLLSGIIGETAPQAFSQEPPIQTNLAGAVVIRGLAGEGPLHADIAVQADGYAAKAVKVDLASTTNLINLRLAPGRILRGQVLDEAGNPVPDVVVQTDYDFKNQVDKRFEWRTHTDLDGRFVWDSAPETEVSYWFEAAGYEVIRGRPLLADNHDLQITLTRVSPK
jgi:RNA polymerase sigma factor (sigma-70 family)